MLGSGKITVPSAMNLQDISVFVAQKNGTFLFDKNKHSLIKVNDVDMRKMIAGLNSKVEIAPTFLLLVSDLLPFEGKDDFNMMMGHLILLMYRRISILCVLLWMLKRYQE